MLRTGRKGLAAATLIGDMLKGTAAVLLMDRFGGTDAGLVAGLGAVLGHVFPVWLGFKGGKGVATYIGVLIAVSWLVALAFAAIWAAVAALTRYSSLSGLIASALTPLLLCSLRRRQTGAAVPGADRDRLGHAPRQHPAAARRHRTEDRPQGRGGLFFRVESVKPHGFIEIAGRSLERPGPRMG